MEQMLKTLAGCSHLRVLEFARGSLLRKSALFKGSAGVSQLRALSLAGVCKCHELTRLIELPAPFGAFRRWHPAWTP